LAAFNEISIDVAACHLLLRELIFYKNVEQNRREREKLFSKYLLYTLLRY